MEAILALLDDMVRGDSHAVRSALKDQVVSALVDHNQKRVEPDTTGATTEALRVLSVEHEALTQKHADLKDQHALTLDDLRAAADIVGRLEANLADRDTKIAELEKQASEAKEKENGPTDSELQAPVVDGDRHQAEGEAEPTA